MLKKNDKNIRGYVGIPSVTCLRVERYFVVGREGTTFVLRIADFKNVQVLGCVCSQDILQ